MGKYSKFDDGDRGSIKQQVVAGPVGAGSSQQKKRALRWLGLLFVVTLFLLLFQVVLGRLTNTLTLIADAAHGAADVVSYALNFSVEWLKVKRQQSKSDAAASTRVVDTWGSLMSLVLLVFATVFAVDEAVARLAQGSKKHNAVIGPALFLFAVVSTMGNASLLAMYYHWHRKGKRVDAAAKALEATKPGNAGDALPPTHLDPPTAAGPATIGSTSSPVPTPPIASPRAASPVSPGSIVPPSVQPSDKVGNGFRQGGGPPTNDIIALPVDVPSLPAGIAVGRPARGPRRERERSKGLSLCSDFGGGGTVPADGGNPSGQTQSCQKLCCAAPGVEMATATECPAGAEGVGGGMLAALHLAVHPGCTCEHGEECADTGTSTKEVATSAGRNLNLIAAMLHLVTDVLRGVLILVVSVFILMGGVRDEERADAICALVIAALIAVGSIALLLRVLGRLYSFFSPDEYAKAPEPPPHADV